jgi:hypothetical protein
MPDAGIKERAVKLLRKFKGDSYAFGLDSLKKDEYMGSALEGAAAGDFGKVKTLR